MFTERHYWIVAYIIRDGIKSGKLGTDATDFLIDTFRAVFQRDNPRFKPGLFEHVSRNTQEATR